MENRRATQAVKLVVVDPFPTGADLLGPDFTNRFRHDAGRDARRPFNALLARSWAGDVVAMGELAQGYAAGQVLQRDDRLAIALWTRAANGDDAASARELGFVFQSGTRGMARSEATARYWFRRCLQCKPIMALDVRYAGAEYQRHDRSLRESAQFFLFLDALKRTDLPPDRELARTMMDGVHGQRRALMEQELARLAP